MSRILSLLALLGLFSLVTGCAVNPATGKTDFVMMTEESELKLGRDHDAEIRKQMPRYSDEKLQTYVQKIGERVARYGDRPNLPYQFTVIDSPEVNAFAIPGGYIYIYRGLMAYLGSEAELAAVLGHEIGHVTARHTVRQQSQSIAWNILGHAVAAGTGVKVAGQATSLLGSFVVLGYGRDMELEADGLGAKYLARSNYNPAAMIQVVRTLKNQADFAEDEAVRKGQAKPTSSYHGLFSTHPDNDKRLKEALAGAQSTSTQQDVGRERYLKAVEGLPFGGSAETGVLRGQQFYHSILNFTLSYPQGWGVINKPDALIGHSADKQAYLGMKLLNRDQLSPEEFLLKASEYRVQQVERLQQAGLTGAAGIILGSPAQRVAVLYKGKQAFLFIANSTDLASLQRADPQFMQIIRSFRPLRPEEQKLAQPRRIVLVQVRPGQTIEQLLRAEGDGSPDTVNQIRLLNDLYPDGQPKPGDWLKILR